MTPPDTCGTAKGRTYYTCLRNRSITCGIEHATREEAARCTHRAQGVYRGTQGRKRGLIVVENGATSIEPPDADGFMPTSFGISDADHYRLRAIALAHDITLSQALSLAVRAFWGG